MKNNNNLFISSIFAIVAYILMLITMASVEKMTVLFLISLVVYIVGVVLSIVYTVKAFKKDNQSEEISHVVPITIMLFFSFCPLGIFIMWKKTTWKKPVKILLTVLVPIIAISISVQPVSTSSSSPSQETSNVTTTARVSTTNQIISTQPTTQITTETTTVTTTQETTTEQQTESTTEETTTKQQKSGKTVYVTPHGEKWHKSKACAGKNAIEKDYNDVKNSYDPCKKCAS